MKAIQTIIVATLVLLAITALAVGIFGGALHQLIVGVVALIVAYIVFNSDKEDREYDRQFKDINKKERNEQAK